MNFTRWSARLPGTQRRAAARDDRSPVPAARAEYAQAQAAATLPDGTLPATPDTASATTATGPALDDLSAREILGRLPVAVALLHGPDHRVAALAYLTSAAILVVPTIYVAVPWLTELRRLMGH